MALSLKMLREIENEKKKCKISTGEPKNSMNFRMCDEKNCAAHKATDAYMNNNKK